MSTRRARVIVAYATVKLNDPVTGKLTVRGFPEGAVFPAEADPENVANLVRREYAEWLDSSEAKAADKEEASADKAEAVADAEVAAPAKAPSKATGSKA